MRKLTLPSGAEADEADVEAMINRYSPVQRFECADAAVSSLPVEEKLALYRWGLAIDLKIDNKTPKYYCHFFALCVAALHRGVEPLDIAKAIAETESAAGVLL